MINIGFGPNILLGLILGFGVILLYFLRVVKPEVARDEDIFFATIGLLYSCILMVHGWRLDPILLFSQVLIIISLLGYFCKVSSMILAAPFFKGRTFRFKE